MLQRKFKGVIKKFAFKVNGPKASSCFEVRVNKTKPLRLSEGVFPCSTRWKTFYYSELNKQISMCVDVSDNYFYTQNFLLYVMKRVMKIRLKSSLAVHPSKGNL